MAKVNYRLIESLLKEGPMQSTGAGMPWQQDARPPSVIDPFDVQMPNVQDPEFDTPYPQAGQSTYQALGSVKHSVDQLLNFVWSAMQGDDFVRSQLEPVVQHIAAAKTVLDRVSAPNSSAGVLPDRDPLADPMAQFR